VAAAVAAGEAAVVRARAEAEEMARVAGHGAAEEAATAVAQAVAAHIQGINEALPGIVAQACQK